MLLLLLQLVAVAAIFQTSDVVSVVTDATADSVAVVGFHDAATAATAVAVAVAAVAVTGCNCRVCCRCCCYCFQLL